MLLVLAVGGFATSCSEDDVDKGPAGGILGNGVYFPTTAASVQFFVEGQTQLQIPVCRSVDTEAFEIQVISDTTNPEIFTFPDYAQFAAGELETVFTITIDASAVEQGVEYGISLLLSDNDNLSSYGAPSYEFTAMIDPWIDLEGEGTFEDYFLFEETYKVKIRRHVNNPNMYRVVDPWSDGLEAEGYVEAGIAASTYSDHFDFVVDPETGLITYEDTLYALSTAAVGVSGNFYLFHPSKYNLEVSYNRQLMDGVFQIAPLVANEAGQGWSYATEPTIFICLPGCVNIQPQMAAEYAGTFTDPDGNAEAVFEVVTNSDVSTYLWSVVDAEADLNAALAAMISGEDPNVQEEIGAEALEGTELRYFLDTPGSYVALFLPKAANSGEVIYGTPIAVEFEFSIGGGVAPADFTAEIEITDVTYNSATVNVTPVANNLTYYFGVTSKSSWDALPESEYGTIDQLVLSNWEAYAEYYEMELMEFIEYYELLTKGPASLPYKGNLAPETTYVAYAYCIDTNTLLARSAVSFVEFTTDPKPDVSAGYAAWLGTWTVSNAAGDSFDITIVEKDLEQVFEIYGWSSMPSMAQVTGGEEFAIWALYDPEDASLGLQSETIATNQDGSIAVISAYVDDTAQSFYPMLVDSGVAYLKAYTTDGLTATMPNTTVQAEDGSALPIAALECFYADYTQQQYAFMGEKVVTGPFTFTKSAATATTSSMKKGTFEDDLFRARLSEDRVNKLPIVIRRNFMAKHNLVMVR